MSKLELRSNKILISCIFIIFIAVVFGLTAKRAISLGMDVKPGFWAVEAISPALSSLAFDHKIKYTTLSKIKNNFNSQYETYIYDENAVNKSIAHTLSLDKTQVGDEFSLLGIDDKGIVDFVSIAFKIFGFKSQSILYLYFLILFLSSSVFIIANFKRPSNFTALLSFWVMLYLIMPMIKYNPQLASILALRALPILSMIACLHCILFVMQKQHKVLDYVLVTLQLLIIIFTIHLRTTTQWQLYIIGLASLYFFCSNFLSKNYLLKDKIKINLGTLWLIFSIVVGSILLNTYRDNAFKAYDGSATPITRVFWHNIFSGLAFSPELAERYDLKIDDHSIFNAAKEYLQETGRESEWKEIANSNDNPIYWDAYDQVTKEMLISRCSSFPTSCLASVFYYKPISFIKQLGWIYGMRHLPPDIDILVSEYFGDVVKTQIIETTRLMDTNGQRAYLWSPIALTLLFTFILSCFYQFDLKILYAVVILSIGSIIPIIVGYPNPHIISDSAIAMGMLIYSCLGVLFHTAYGMLTKARNAPSIVMNAKKHFYEGS